ncbi:unnamed protein product, partial [Ectocarpus sp. 6 AP-2014]
MLNVWFASEGFSTKSAFQSRFFFTVSIQQDILASSRPAAGSIWKDTSCWFCMLGLLPDTLQRCSSSNQIARDWFISSSSKCSIFLTQFATAYLQTQPSSGSGITDNFGRTP